MIQLIIQPKTTLNKTFTIYLDSIKNIQNKKLILIKDGKKYEGIQLYYPQYINTINDVTINEVEIYGSAIDLINQLCPDANLENNTICSWIKLTVLNQN